MRTARQAAAAKAAADAAAAGTSDMPDEAGPSGPATLPVPPNLRSSAAEPQEANGGPSKVRAALVVLASHDGIHDHLYAWTSGHHLPPIVMRQGWCSLGLHQRADACDQCRCDDRPDLPACLPTGLLHCSALWQGSRHKTRVLLKLACHFSRR